MKNIIILILAFTSTTSFSQTKTVETTPSRSESIDVEVAQKDAEFPGGLDAMHTFIRENIKYPQAAIEKGENGNVYVQFIIDANGAISDVKILRGISASLDAEAIRVVRKMPNWIPAEKNGQKIKVDYNLPIHFSVN